MTDLDPRCVKCGAPETFGVHGIHGGDGWHPFRAATPPTPDPRPVPYHTHFGMDTVIGPSEAQKAKAAQKSAEGMAERIKAMVVNWPEADQIRTEGADTPASGRDIAQANVPLGAVRKAGSLSGLPAELPTPDPRSAGLTADRLHWALQKVVRDAGYGLSDREIADGMAALLAAQPPAPGDVKRRVYDAIADHYEDAEDAARRSEDENEMRLPAHADFVADALTPYIVAALGDR